MVGHSQKCLKPTGMGPRNRQESERPSLPTAVPTSSWVLLVYNPPWIVSSAIPRPSPFFLPLQRTVSSFSEWLPHLILARPGRELRKETVLFFFFPLIDTPHSSNLSGVRIERHTCAFLNPRTKTTALIPPILRAGSFPDYLRLSDGGVYSSTFEPHEFSHQ